MEINKMRILFGYLLMTVGFFTDASAGVKRLSQILHKIPVSFIKSNGSRLTTTTAAAATTGTLINGQLNEKYDTVTDIVIEFQDPAVTNIEHTRKHSTRSYEHRKSFNHREDTWETEQYNRASSESEDTLDEWQAAGRSCSSQGTNTSRQHEGRYTASYSRYYAEPSAAYRWFKLSGNSKEEGLITINMSELSDARTRADYKRCKLVLSQDSLYLEGTTEDTNTEWDDLDDGETTTKRIVEKVSFKDINQSYKVTVRQQSWWDWICNRYAASCTVQDNRPKAGRS